MSNLENAVLEGELKDALDFIDDKLLPSLRGDDEGNAYQLSGKLERILHYVQVGEWPPEA